ncbi:MAG: 4-hydroxy-tetrahydrodipicolinate reductase [Bacteroidota bacterium]
MKIGLIGYGKMGKEIEQQVSNSGHEITAIYSLERLFLSDNAPDCDVFIEFSFPSAVESHIEHAIQLGKPIVIGTTGWYEKLPSIRQKVGDSIGCVYSGNFSPGIHVMKKLIAELSKNLSTIGGYDISLLEIHHRNKLDSPSGTAHLLSAPILEHFTGKNYITTSPEEATHDIHALHISSMRCGDIVGEHTVMADSIIDNIQITHTAKNRTGFAQGAILAAEWILNKKGLYEFSELFS